MLPTHALRMFAGTGSPQQLPLLPPTRRALEYVAGAEAAEPRSLATGFLRLKVCLAAHGGAGASDAVAALADCEGFTPDVLRVGGGRCLSCRAGEAVWALHMGQLENAWCI